MTGEIREHAEGLHRDPEETVASDRVPRIDERPDPEIARDAVDHLRNELPYSSQFIEVTVRGGALTLAGSLEWNYQRERAEMAVLTVQGIAGVSNHIALVPHVDRSEIERKVEDALRRRAELDQSRGLAHRP
jgi:osmotically-inducible protein OsmY